MTCRHCHVDAGPDRTDAMMSDEVVEQVIAAHRGARAPHTVDVTGGAPELHPRFRDLVAGQRRRAASTSWTAAISPCCCCRATRAWSMARRARRRSRRLAAALPPAEHRRAARRRRLRALDRGAAAAQRGRLRQGRSAPAPDAGVQPRRRLPRRRPGFAGARMAARRCARQYGVDVRPAVRAQQHADLALSRVAGGRPATSTPTWSGW